MLFCTAFPKISTLPSLLLLIIGFLSFPIDSAQAQHQSQYAEDLFNIAAEKHKREIDHLRGMRGLPPVPVMRDTSVTSIREALAYRDPEVADPYDPYVYVNSAGYQDGTAVLFYAYDRGQFQTWLLNQDGIQAYHRQNLSEEQLSHAINSMRQSLRVESLQLSRISQIDVIPPQTRSPRIPLTQAVTDLTNLLIPELIADKLEDIKHLIVVPVLGLGTVPYAMLQPFEDGTYLIEEMSVSIASSLYDLDIIGVGSWSTEWAYASPLIVGNPLFPVRTLSPLPGAEEEVKAVADLMDSQALIGAQAAKEEVVARSRRATLLYFATHGFSSALSPLEEGYLIFSAETYQQARWTAEEIQDMRFPRVALAVLSACQTGLGQVHDAGIIGLARAFQIGGAQRVVMSLWRVDDDSTNALMQAFVRNLDTHIPSEALRLAMLEVKETYPRPADWASFTLFGTPR